MPASRRASATLGRKPDPERHRELIEKLRTVLNAGAMIEFDQNRTGVGIRYPASYGAVTFDERFSSEITFIERHRLELGEVLALPLIRLFPQYAFRMAFLSRLYENPLANDLFKMLSERPELASRMQLFAGSYFETGKEMKPESKKDWRDRGRRVVRLFESHIDALSFEELLNDMYSAEECRRLAGELDAKLDVIKTSRLYDARRLGLRRYWILIPVELLLERGLGKKPTVAEVMMVLDAAGLGAAKLPELDTFRRNCSEFEKHNPQLVRWLRNIFLGHPPS